MRPRTSNLLDERATRGESDFLLGPFVSLPLASSFPIVYKLYNYGAWIFGQGLCPVLLNKISFFPSIRRYVCICWASS